MDIGIHEWDNEVCYGCVTHAANERWTPRTNLNDRIAARVVHGTTSCPQSYLTPKKQKELVSFLFTTGYPKTNSEVTVLGIA